jgi:hypothetical protein
MVTVKALAHITLTPLLLTSLILILTPSTLQAQTIQYHLDHQYAKIWINQDGTIDLLYDITITCDQGTINYINIGQPNGDFTIGPATDEHGHNLTTAYASEGSNYRARVYLHTPITTTQSVQFTLITNVVNMIWQEEDPERVGLEFIPCDWAANLNELRVLVVLPAGVNQINVGCTPDWDNAYSDPAEDNRLVVYWERQNLQPNQKFTCGVSFPKAYIEHYEVAEGGIVAFLKNYGGFIAFFLLISVVIGGIIYAGRKASYIKPTMKMETLGIRRGLTAVEASHLLGLKPTKIVTAILYSLLKKRAVWVTTTKPSVKLKVVEPSTPEPEPLRYYERTFLDAVQKDGTLSEEKLAKAVMEIRDEVEEKLRGYCRKDTAEYYEKIVSKAWEQVEQAETAELASKAYDEQLLWLLLNESFQSRTEKAFETRAFEPAPLWFWYWYGYHYRPTPEYKPTTTPPANQTPTPKIPGADFANNIAVAVEGTTNSIVVNLEKFANAIIPAPPPSQKTSRQPVRSASSCACACAACAFVCACVSCACACASGGVG